MQASTHQPQAHRGTKTKAAKELPYPDLEAHEDKLFWLAAYFCELSQLIALQGHVQELLTNPARSIVLITAMHTCLIDAEQRVKDSADYVLEDGLLLFAHTDNTVFMQAGGAA